VVLLGLNIGDEEDGKNNLYERPVLVLKKFNRRIFLGVPLTTKVKDNKYYVEFIHDDRPFAALVSQIRLVSTKRLSRKVRKMDRPTFQRIKTAVQDLL